MPTGVSKQCLTAAARPLRRQATCKCACLFSPRLQRQFQSRELSTSKAFRDGAITQPMDTTPRWKATPPRMAAPFRSRLPVDNRFHVNEDPKKLDRTYIRFLGKDGDKMLTEEVKWLAVTHKSFDHGRRGYNDRLAFLGTETSVHLRGLIC